jgi:hypothetical protein
MTNVHTRPRAVTKMSVRPSHPASDRSTDPVPDRGRAARTHARAMSLDLKGCSQGMVVRGEGFRDPMTKNSVQPQVACRPNKRHVTN